MFYKQNFAALTLVGGSRNTTKALGKDARFVDDNDGTFELKEDCKGSSFDTIGDERAHVLSLDEGLLEHRLNK